MNKRTWLRVSLLFLFCGCGGGESELELGSEAPIEAAEQDVECLSCPRMSRRDVAPAQPRRVQVLIFNPIIESAGGQRLTQVRGWNDPLALEQQYIQEVSNATNAHVSYLVVSRTVVDAIPKKKDGYQYTDASYLACCTDWGCTQPQACHSPDLADYVKILNDYGSCAMRNANQIDEVWLFGGPYFGFWEAVMAGPGAFDTNGPPITGTSCQRPLHVMGFSYQREVKEMLENLSHRVEGTMEHHFGSWGFPYGPPPSSPPSNMHDWNKFSVKHYDPGPPAACGFAHGSVNTPAWSSSNWWSYDFTNLNVVPSTCADYDRYPKLTGATQNLDCRNWGCSHLGWMRYWLGKVPNFADADHGVLNSWWRYVVDYDQATAIKNGSFESSLSSWRFGRINRVTSTDFERSGQSGMVVNQPCDSCPSDYPVYGFYQDFAGAHPVGTQVTYTIWANHLWGGSYSGRIVIWELGGASPNRPHVTSFTVNHADGWVRLARTATVVDAGRTALRAEIYLDTPNNNIAFDDAALLAGPADPVSTVAISAKGTICQGGYPVMKLTVYDNEVARWTVTSSFATYRAQVPGTAIASNVKVHFINDCYVPGQEDRNLIVDWMELNGTRYQTESPNTYAIGASTGGSCLDGYVSVEKLACNGYFRYDAR